eukprot:TRINITY_DN603_c0_g4_i1.p1 TRINITY_DN603_c0_g4~~TRINITY_DN603_c0_g4_i1.p1  ORF type:complete len:249 (-),score=52.78 TRINITY_DN603_c0_g4_i1:41-787(-)
MADNQKPDSSSDKSQNNSQLLKKIQISSGVVFSSFLSFHLLNTGISHFGQQAYDGVQLVLREVYKNPFFEFVLFGSIVAHASSSLLILAKRKAQSHLPLQLKLHRYAGYFVMAAIGGHILGTRGNEILEGITPDFSLISFTVDYIPGMSVYYAIFSISALYHMMFGLRQAYNWFLLRNKSKQTENAVKPKSQFSRFLFNGLLIVGGIVLVSSVVAFSGAYFPIAKSRYPEFVGKYKNFLGEAWFEKKV